MWDCLKCLTKNIAHDLGFCPHCYEDRPSAPAGEPTAPEPASPGADSSATAATDPAPATGDKGKR
jgi:hypothetical protein